jgi:hypothetical protein
MSWTIGDGMNQWDVEVVVEGQRIPSLGGQQVRLAYDYQFGGFAPTTRLLSVQTLMSPSHGVWAYEGGDVPNSGSLPLLLTRGNVACTAIEQCGSYARYGLSATDPMAMGSVNVPHGQTKQMGPWVIVHGGYEEETSSTMQCADWFVADLHVAILGLM